MNGIDIFKGDKVIQRIRAHDEDGRSYELDPHVYEVIFEYGCFLLSRPYGDTRYMRDFAHTCEFIGLDKYEIIGHIYENHERHVLKERNELSE